MFIYITIETLRKIARFGDVVYHSYKMRYVHLYVDEDKVEDILKELDGMKAVKKSSAFLLF